MLTHYGRRMVSHVEGTNTVYELVPTNRLPANLPPVREWKLYGLKATQYRYVMEGFWFWDNYHMDKGEDIRAALLMCIA